MYFNLSNILNTENFLVTEYFYGLDTFSSVNGLSTSSNFNHLTVCSVVSSDTLVSTRLQSVGGGSAGKVARLLQIIGENQR